MNKHLIKRSANLTDSGSIELEKIDGCLVDIKLNSKPSGTNKIQPNDEIYLAESGYAIYGKAIIVEITCTAFVGIEGLLKYFFCETKATKVDNYFYSILKTYYGKTNPQSVFWIREMHLEKGEYFKIPFLLQDPFLNPQQTYFELNNDFNLNNVPSINNALISKIPGYLRKKIVLDYNIDTKRFTIDIDHHVPKSIGGPGNICENLIPMGPSYNRAKSDSIPSYLFKYAHEYQLGIIIPKSILNLVSAKHYFTDKFSKELAKNIVVKINEDYESAKKAYKIIKDFHFPSSNIF